MNSQPGQRKVLHRQAEQQVQSTQPEKRNVAEPIHPAFETAVAAEPVFALEKHSERHAGNEAEENPEPGKQEIWIRFHLIVPMVPL